MRPETRVYLIALGITLSLALPIFGIVVTAAWIPGTPLENVRLHGLLEISGGLMAIAIAGILTIERPRKPEATHYTAMACALGAMGVFDLFHATVSTENSFVWLHSAATFIGGLLFASVWLGDRKLSRRAAWFAPVRGHDFSSCSSPCFLRGIPLAAHHGFRRRVLQDGSTAEHGRRCDVHPGGNLFRSPVSRTFSCRRLAVCSPNDAVRSRWAAI